LSQVAAEKPKKLSTWQSLVQAFTSWRTASVSLLSFSSGMPLGLVWIAIPDWMRDIGVDIRVVGLLTLAQAPWTFKFLWAPLLDRYYPPRLGRRRGWIAITQVALFALGLMLAGVGDHPETPWVVAALALAIAFAASTQDIAVDAYAVDVLRPEEQALAVGARNFIYRIGMTWVAGGAAITLAGTWGWAAVNVALAVLYLPMILITLKAPEPQGLPAPPKTLREAVWYPFLGFLSRHRALEILAFVLCYKIADNLVQSLQRPFLNDMGYNEMDRGLALATVGVAGNIIGTFAGGLLTAPLGLGRSLWIFGFFQIFSNAGYAILAAQDGVNRPLMLAAIGFEQLSSGLGSGAFSVFLLRLTQKRFSATQYALFSSLFGLPRVIAGPIAGYSAYALGWETFFWWTLPVGIPGMILLARFVPFNAREPEFRIEPPRIKEPLTGTGLFLRGLTGTVVGTGVAAFLVAFLDALKVMKDTLGAPFDLATPLAALVRPEDTAGIVTIVGLLTFGVVCGLFTAAVAAARHGAGQDLALDEIRPDMPA
jgi:PAT family beta-lactamase induction signal transducer AmpG